MEHKALLLFSQQPATCPYPEPDESIPQPPTVFFNPLKPNDFKRRRTAQLTSRYCILFIYSTNIRTEYFKYAA